MLNEGNIIVAIFDSYIYSLLLLSKKKISKMHYLFLKITSNL